MESEKYIILAHKYLTNSCTKEEKTAFLYWLDEDQINRESFQMIKMVWEKTVHESEEAYWDAALAAQRFKNNIYQKEAQVKTVRKRPPRLVRIAAAIATLLVCMYAIHFFRQGEPTWEVVENQGNDPISITLPDHSEVVLNEKTTLKYIKDFVGNERKLAIEGEAFFKVTENKTKPFLIESNYCQIQVVGTRFNVRSVPGESVEEVWVESGKVLFQKKGSNQVLSLTPLETGIYTVDDGGLTKKVSNDQNAMAWMSSELSFYQTPMLDVVEDLERYFDISIKVEDESMNDCTFNSPFTNPNLDEVLKTLESIFGFEIKKSNAGSYVLEGGSCK